MKKAVGWTSSRLTIRLLNLKRPQLNRVVQVLTGHCNLQRHKKTTGRAESSLCPKCSLENETPNHHVGNCMLHQDICVKYCGINKTTVYHVVTKYNINELAMYLKEVGRLSEFYQYPIKTTSTWQLQLHWAQKRPTRSVGIDFT